MKYFELQYIALAVGILLILIGLWGVLTQKNIIKIIVGFSLFDTGLHVILVAISYLKGKKAPILDNSVALKEAASQITDPLPQALVLTAIVIGLGITALMLVYALKLYQQKRTLDIDKFTELKN